MFFALSGSEEDEENQDSLAHRFCAFALKTLNEDMDPVFTKHMAVFDQSRQEFEQQGETHEQYAAYTDYLATLEAHILNFALEQGYNPGDGGTFLAQMQQAIDEDKARAEKQVEVFLENMQRQRNQMLGPDAPPIDESELRMVKQLFKPQTVDDMMQMILHMTEYTAFSSLMRAKVQQQKFIEEMERKKQELLMGEMGLAHRFIQFAMKLLNDDMHEFYKRWMPIFDQEAENLENQGQTHEQYSAFLEYASIIEKHLFQFCEQEGFGQDAMSLFEELQRLVQKDQANVDAQLKKILADVEQKKEQMRARAREEGQSGEPMVLVCKPAALGDLINSLIQQTEYQTFSATMRFRVEQERVIKMLLSGGGQSSSSGQAALTDGAGNRLSDLEVVDVEIDENRVPQPPPGLGTVSVTVPEGCEAGSQISVNAPDGQQLTATVPGGLSPGMSFDVSYCPKGPGAAGPHGYGGGGCSDEQASGAAVGYSGDATS